MKTKRRKFTDEFRRDVVSMIEKEGYTLKEASAKFDIHESLLAKWKKQYGSQVSSSVFSQQDHNELELLRKTNKKLERELRRSQQEKEILKKAKAFFVIENQ